MRAGLSGTISQEPSFELQIHAPGIEADFIDAARNAAITVLLSQSWSPVFAVRLTLSEFLSHPHESSYAAFYMVAQEVVSHLIGTAPGTENNIEW